MARPRERPLGPSDIEGLEYFDTLVPLLARLKEIGSECDRAGNRSCFTTSTSACCCSTS
jgi:hypothetical protein